MTEKEVWLTIATMAKRFGFSKGKAYKLIARHGLEMRPNPEDARTKLVRLSDFRRVV